MKLSEDIIRDTPSELIIRRSRKVRLVMLAFVPVFAVGLLAAFYACFHDHNIIAGIFFLSTNLAFSLLFIYLSLPRQIQFDFSTLTVHSSPGLPFSLGNVTFSITDIESVYVTTRLARHGLLFTVRLESQKIKANGLYIAGGYDKSGLVSLAERLASRLIVPFDGVRNSRGELISPR